MCYSNCPNEMNNGECKGRINNQDSSLHCFEGFICEGCDHSFQQYENENDSNYCNDCFEEHDIKECKQCNSYQPEVVDGICDKCYTLNEKNNA